MLGRNRSSIMREIKCNGSNQCQVSTSMYADKQPMERKSITNRHARLKGPFIRDRVHEKLKDQQRRRFFNGKENMNHQNVNAALGT